MINPEHLWVKLEKVEDWKKLDETFCKTFCPRK